MEGDRAGGRLKPLKKVDTRDKCVDQVLQHHPDADGVTYSGSSTGNIECFAIYGGTGLIRNKSNQTCVFGIGTTSCQMVLFCLHNISYVIF